MNFRNRFLSSLDETTSARLLPHVREVSLSQGDTLIDEGSLPDRAWFPTDVVLSSVVTTAGGRAIEVATFGYHDVVGALSCLGQTASTSRVFAQTSGVAVSIPGAVLRAEALDNPAVLTLLLRSIEATSRQAELNVACHAFHDAPHRIARWLLLTQDRLGRNPLPLTQSDLAVMAGVQRTTINAGAMQLKAAGLIRYSRGHVQIVDRAGLETQACDCYAALTSIRDGRAENSAPAKTSQTPGLLVTSSR
jgi:CRP-like cAMP-binding protein